MTLVTDMLKWIVALVENNEAVVFGIIATFSILGAIYAAIAGLYLINWLFTLK